MTETPDSAADTDRSRCPLCGGRNQCALEAGKDPRSCWCMATDISFSDDLLNKVPAPLRGQACICEACVRRLAQRVDG
ncbi:MAG: cysteine-rich CWC family protein [Pseudomonadota bacterium]|nr:cysteine-rich CWC family protein [Pseudomonadota bacterium]